MTLKKRAADEELIESYRAAGIEDVGFPLFGHETEQTFRDRLRRFLVLLQVENGHAFTLKGFRSGKASAMVAAGYSLKQAMDAGEWRSGSISSYINEEVIDATRLLALMEDEAVDD